MLAGAVFLLSAAAVFAQSSETGIASYYGDQFDGHLTASGQPYDPNAMTAAHRTLRLGVRLEVVNLDNGKWTVVTVNDRGPFVKGRLIDLSKAAAEKLGMIASGTARVRIWPIPLDETPAPPADLAEILKAAHERQKTAQPAGPAAQPTASPAATEAPAAEPQPAASMPAEGGTLYLQVGAFKSQANAKVFAQLLQQEGFSAKVRTDTVMNRVYLEAPNADAAQNLVQTLHQKGHPQVLLLHSAPAGTEIDLTSN